MTRIDFYLLEVSGDAVLVDLACRLCDKATGRGQRVYVYSDSADITEALDTALWTFRQGSFVSHEIYAGAVDAEVLPAVLLGLVVPPTDYREIMINLAGDTPQFFSQFERVLEVVPTDAAARNAARARYRFYHDRGYPLDVHKLGSTDNGHAR